MAHAASNTEKKPTNGISTSQLAKSMSRSKSNLGQEKKVPDMKAMKDLTTGELDKPTTDAIKRWARKPSGLYKELFGSKPMSSEQMIRQSLNAPVMIFPQSVIGLLQKKIKGAQTRVTNRRIEIQELRVALKNGVVLKHGRVVGITPAEKKSLQQRKLHAEADLIKAKDDMTLFRQNLAEALARNGDPLRADIRSVREMAHIRRVAPSISKQILEYVKLKTGVKENLINLKRDTPAEEVSDAFLNIVKDGNDKAYKLLSAKPMLATQVRQRVFEQITK